jgi:hypothetical protein
MVSGGMARLGGERKVDGDDGAAVLEDKLYVRHYAPRNPR